VLQHRPSPIATGGSNVTLPDPSYRMIPLTKGQWAIVSVEDYDSLIQYSWQSCWNRWTKSYYAQRNGKMVSGKREPTVQMHRQILGLIPHDGKQVDHINRNTLDNRRENLRLATSAQNQHNSPKKRINTSGYKGVYFHSVTGLWHSRIVVQGKIIYLGYFRKKEDAAEAYRLAAIKYHGDFACVAS